MESTILAKPVKVSSFIKAVRWGLLIYGIIHGNLQWDIYHRHQTKIREEREKVRPEIEARKEREKLEAKTNDIKILAAELDLELPPNWTAEGV